jgi:hypothetical protein
MPEGLGPRFVLEAAFLILLAAVAAYARLSATGIILVMAGGWLLASIFEVLAARRERVYPTATWERRAATADAAAVPEAQRRLSWFRRRLEVSTPTPQEAVAAESVPPRPAPSEEADDESTGEIDLSATKRRRWFRRNRAEHEQAANEIVERPSARHVRLIRPRGADPPEERKDVESG